MSNTELGNLPKIGTVVRSKVTFNRIQKGASCRVKEIVSGGCNPSVIVETISGEEFTISAEGYSRFFEACEPNDSAWDYWSTADPGEDWARLDLGIDVGNRANLTLPDSAFLRYFVGAFRRVVLRQKV